VERIRTYLRARRITAHCPAGCLYEWRFGTVVCVEHPAKGAGLQLPARAAAVFVRKDFAILLNAVAKAMPSQVCTCRVPVGMKPVTLVEALGVVSDVADLYTAYCHGVRAGR